MSTRRDTVYGWRSRLEETEALLTTGSARMRWLRRIYARVYRFLISRYGDEEKRAGENPAAEPASDCATPSGMPFMDNRKTDVGREPKSAVRIRDTLDRLHTANDQNPAAGPLSKGLVDEAWITVASESARVSSVRCQRLLKNEGIPARIVRRGDDRMVEVRLDHRDKAFSLIQKNRTALRTQIRRRKGRLLGAIYGLTFGMAVTVLAVVTVGLAGMDLTAMPHLRTLAMVGGALGAVFGWICGIPYHRRK